MVRKEPTEENTTAVVPVDGFTEEQLSQVESMADVLQMVGGRVDNIADVLGNGFSVLEDKSRLIGVEFVIIKYGSHLSETTGKYFTTLHVVTGNNEKLIVNDGSTGIHEQCNERREKDGYVAPLYVPRGLRVSEYDYTDDDGKKKKARTYYLNTGK